jgi:enoyl-CoA hydratase/carnithine racemase
MPRVELEISNRVARLTLTRPEALNAIDPAMLREFEAALRQVRQSSDVVVLVTQGSGRAFSAGSDLKELAKCSPQEAAEFEAEHGRVFAQLETLPQITVAAWRGYVLGGGLFMGVYHDFRVAAQGASIGLPEVAHGWTPPWGVSRLVELVGWQAAKRLMLYGGQFDGASAQRMGLADVVWPDEVFEAQLRGWLEELASRPVTALRETKALLREMRALDHAHWERRAAEAFQRCYETDEAQQAVQRFVKRA